MTLVEKRMRRTKRGGDDYAGSYGFVEEGMMVCRRIRVDCSCQ